MNDTQNTPEPSAEEIAGGSELRKIIIDVLNSKQYFTDIHIEQDEVIRWDRPHGLIDLDDKPVATIHMLRGLLYSLNPDWETVMKETGHIAKSITWEKSNSRIRIVAYYIMERTKLVVTIRRHSLTPPKIGESCLPEAACRLINFNSKGLFIITGPTGSGKTTTLASIIDFFNTEAKTNQEPRYSHIVTIEQPIEYLHPRGQAVISPRSVPGDAPTFAQGLKDALQQRPNIIMIGEVRDAETAETMFHAAESGHLVFATLHTNSAVAALNKLLSFFPEQEWTMRRMMLVNTLMGIVSQVRIPTVDKTRSLVVAEYFLNNGNKKVQAALANGNFHEIQAMMEAGEEFNSLTNALIDLVKAAKITGETAVRASYNPLTTMERVKNIKR